MERNGATHCSNTRSACRIDVLLSQIADEGRGLNGSDTDGVVKRNLRQRREEVRVQAMQDVFDV